MRILVVTTNYPFPPLVGSSIVAFNAIKYLSRDNFIDLVCFQSPDQLIEPAQFVKNVILVRRENRLAVATAARYIWHILLGIPPSVAAWRSQAMANKIKELVGHNDYDAILLFELNTLQYVPSSCYNKVAINVEDPPALKLRRMAKLPIYSLGQKLKYLIAAQLTAAYENKYFPRVAKVILLSEEDILDLGGNSKFKNLAYVPYGVDSRATDDILNYEQRNKVIIFSGNMYHLPNVDGVLYFLNNIFPLILKYYPSVILQIVGSRPDPRIIEAAERFGSQVLITGRVADIADYIRKAVLSVCSVRLKIGVQTKILESFSYGTPVVSNVSSNSGIKGVYGVHLWYEDQPEKFAARVAELLHGDGWSKLSQEGRKFALDNFSWENSGRKLVKILQDISIK